MKGVHRLRSLSALLVLALLLCSPLPALAGVAGAPRTEAMSSVHLFLDWLAGFWGDVGCTWDPSGGCRDIAGSEPATGSEGLEVGCTMDPNGGPCRESLDNGCTADPNGSGCREHLDSACGWDPNGGSCRDNG